MIKNIYIIAFLIGTLPSVAQIINVNNSADPESVFGPEALIENVLISSTCTTVSDFSYQVSGQPTDINVKSYGYFKAPVGSVFPFEEGIILTTGRAHQAGNTEIISGISNDNMLGGDADLEAALADLGVIPDTYDATFIKFTFVPIADTISFRFLMASEEYDLIEHYECLYSDGFAFLLREVGTTTYTNLALLPDNSPVSVTNINNSGVCTANPEYFEGYDLPQTNYNGRTKVLTANANVVPNTAYEIKLVVADQEDELFDSAIFLEAGSFNIGLDLGDDLTIGGGNSACTGDVITLDTLIPIATGAHTWYRNGVVISGENDATLDVITNGEYTVEVVFSSTCTATDSIVIEFAPNPILNPINDYFICDTNNDGFWTLELNVLAGTVLGGQSAADFTVTFHGSQLDADNRANPLASPYTNPVAYQQEEIFIRIESNLNPNCNEVDSFLLAVFDQAEANAQTYVLCDNDDDGDDTNGFVEFDLNSMTPLVLASQDPTQFDVTYHLNQSDADNNTSPLPLLYINTTANTQELIVRVENVDRPDICHETATIDLVVNQLPVVLTVVDLFQCDDDFDGYSEFNLTEANALVSGNHLNEVFTYHTNLNDAQNNSSPITNTTNYTNIDPSASPDLLFIRIESIDGCFRTAELYLYVTASQIPATFQLNYDECDNDLIDGDYRNGIATFDFSDADAQISAILPSGQYTITYYESITDALAETNNIPDISNHRNEISPNIQKIIVRVDSDINNACYALGEHITLTVNPIPEENPVADTNFCSDTAGLATIDLNQFDAEVLGSQNSGDFTVTYHESQSDADSGNMPLISPYTTNLSILTVFVRVVNNTSQCQVSTVNFVITIYTNPMIIDPSPLELCDDNNTGDEREIFNLEDKTNEILGSQTGMTLTYYLNQMDADNDTNAISSPYENTVNNEIIYIRAQSDATGCYSTTTLELIVNPLPQSNNDPVNLTLCDDNNPGDEQEIFDLTLNETYILNGEIGVTPTYYISENDANLGLDEITVPNAFSNTVNPQTVYVRVTNDITNCFVVVDFDLLVDPLPDSMVVSDLVECEDNTDGFYDFDLESKTTEVLNGQDSTIFQVTYHQSQSDADTGNAPLASPFTNTISNRQEIFVNLLNTTTGCFVTEQSFFIEVQEDANANQNMQRFVICDYYEDNDGYAQFDLSTRDAEVLNGQNPLIYEVSYYQNFSDADSGVNAIPLMYENTNNPETIFARVSNINTGSNLCYDVTELVLKVDLLPIFDLDDQYVLCLNTNGTEVVGAPLIDTGLSDVSYTFEWRQDGIIIPGANNSSYLALTAGNYYVSATNIATGCNNIDTTVVIESEPPQLLADVKTEAFSSDAIIEATATGIGNYEFSLDNGPWQTSGVFKNVSPGDHTIRARDINGCGL
ncbi:MAG: choice-of-anchor L domain-containing protein, partial [Flavobacteriaceae bacterium]|nr:choice-of-anchor L domain-containing protein [Flavobacteriaceae bacterium]